MIKDIKRDYSGSTKGFTENTDHNSDVNGITGVQLVLLQKVGRMRKLYLPIPADEKGRFRFKNSRNEDDCSFLYFEAKEGKWIACCDQSAYFSTYERKVLNSIEIKDKFMLPLLNEGNQYILFSEYVNRDSYIYHNYFLIEDTKISIGRLPDNDICFPNSYVSSHHATLLFEKGRWYIRDEGSINGVYVNGRKIEGTELFVGDRVYIFGLNLIVGVGFLSINEGNSQIMINVRKLRRIPAWQVLSQLEKPDSHQRTQELFNRAPRRKYALNLPEIVIDAPPMSMNSNKIPLVLRMGSSMMSGGKAVLAGNIFSAMSMLVFPFLTQGYSEKQRKDYEQRRVEKYTEYLGKKKSEIEEETVREKQVLNYNYQSLNEIISYPTDGKRLWERRKTDDDFLNLRVGKGDIPLMAKRVYPAERFDIDEDPLEENMYDLAEKPVFIQQAPIMTSFVEDPICGVLGDRKTELSFVKGLLMQLTILHSYDEVKTVFLIEPEELEEFEIVRYLPHSWDDQKNFRFIATNKTEAYKISEYLQHELEPDSTPGTRKLKDLLKTRPYYVIFALSKQIFDSVEVLKDILQEDENCGVSVLAVFDNLPKECSKLFCMDKSGKHSILYLKQPERAEDFFNMDSYSAEQAEKNMRSLANISLKVISQAYSLPKTLTFLEMFGVGRVEHLMPLKRWQENNPVKSLTVPVGVCTDGSLFYLDLHEKYHGPHGLIAGMTGSGKSEFIITYILAMAVNYHPDEVAFVLIDYKGGGLAGAFHDPERCIHLPHLVGTITNLDGSAIQRSLASIQSELKRRQTIFNIAKSTCKEGTMDIYGYQKLYRNGQMKEPLPHLFIISDEFAELKQQEPEFMEKLISAARIGRSLGVHLILATQKPTGVVNDQILSNTKFRVCLRVQDRTDSMEMLKRPEAAELKDTGRFYLQVGYNEFFALGQSAWCGASYDPQDQMVVQRDDTINLLDSVGESVLEIHPKIKKEASEVKQIVAIVRMLSDIAVNEGIVPRMLWEEPLPVRLSLEDIKEKYDIVKKENIQALIGLTDDPENQTQYPLLLDMENCRNYLVVGESGSGKTTMIQTMIYSLAENFPPEDVNFYILDFSSKLLAVFGNLPHCGAVLMEEQEEAIDRFFIMLRGMIEERKKMFQKAEVNSFSDYRKYERIPLILVVIDNMAGMTSLKKGNLYFSTLHEYMRDGVSFGIKFIISSSHLNEFSGKMRQEAGNRIALKAKDKFEYSDILGCKCNYIPPEVKGRGMCVLEGRPLEFQTILVGKEDDEQERMAGLKKEISRLIDLNAKNKSAKQLPIISEDETYEHFIKSFEDGRIPLGYYIKEAKPIILPLKQAFCLSLYFGNPIGIRPVLDNLLLSAMRSKMEVIIVKKRTGSVFQINEEESISFLESNEADSEKLWRRLVQEITDRKTYRDEFCGQNGIDQPNTPQAMHQAWNYIYSHTRPLLILFESFYDFCKNLHDSCYSIFPAIFDGGKGYNFYFAACFYPDQTEGLSSESLMTAFNKEKFTLLFGGQFHRQGLIILPQQYQQLTEMSEKYNNFLLNYKEKLYLCTMPCGKLLKTEIDIDDLPII